MNDIRNNRQQDIRSLSPFFKTIVCSAFVFFVFGSIAYAQEHSAVEVADASVIQMTGGDEVTQYKGMPLLMEPLASLNYPEEAKRMGVEGRVVLRYTVNKQGKAINIKVISGLGYGCDEEAMRIISEAQFKPIFNAEGEAVFHTFTTPLMFKLQ